MKYFFTLTIFITHFVVVNAQLKLGNNPQTLSPSTALEMESSNKGFLPPRMSTMQRNAVVNPPTGLMIFNTDVACLQINVGTPAAPQWQCVSVEMPAPVLNPTNGNQVSGSTLANCTLLIDLNGDDIPEFTISANASGLFNQSVSPQLLNGVLVRVRARDAYGNTSIPASVNVDRLPPSPPVLDPTNGAVITGTAEPNSTVLIDVNGDGTADYTAQAGSNGFFSQPVNPQLANGTVVSARSRDASGNTSLPATVTVDAQAPAAPTLNPTNGTFLSGTAEPNSTVLIDVNGDGVTDYTAAADNTGFFYQPISPQLANGTVISARSRDAVGNVSLPASVIVDAQVVPAPLLNATNGTSISGTANANLTILIDVNGDGTPDYTTTAAGNGIFSQPANPILTHGTIVSAWARNASGTISQPATVTVDNLAPAAPVLNPSDGTIITGTAEPFSTVLIDVNGDGTPDYTTTANGNGNFSQPVSPVLAHGTEVTVRARDASGNTSPPATVTVDRQAPAPPVLNPSDGTVISGTAEPNSTVLIDVNGDGLIEYITTANGSGNFTQPVSPQLVHNTLISARSRDATGNTSIPATIRTVGPGSVTSLACATATHNGTLFTYTANNVTTVISYTGGDAGTYPLTTALSSGVTGLTATLVSGLLNNGNGNLIFTITGSPTVIGTATFTFTLGGKTCSFSRTVQYPPPAVSTLNCSGLAVSAIIDPNVQITNRTVTLPYTGGNAAPYSLQTLTSSGVNGLIATLNAGTLANGNGTFSFVITGIADNTGLAIFNFSFGTQTCVLKVPVGCGAYMANGVWQKMACYNLGADMVSDPLVFSNNIIGDLYQWGRQTDGHQLRTATGTTTLATSITPGHNQFIIFNLGVWPYDWLSGGGFNNRWGDGTAATNPVKGTNDPCPAGWKVPSNTVWSEMLANNTWTWTGYGYKVGAALYLPAAGFREYRAISIYNVGFYGRYWTATPGTQNSWMMNFTQTAKVTTTDMRASAISVRCIPQ